MDYLQSIEDIQNYDGTYPPPPRYKVLANCLKEIIENEKNALCLFKITEKVNSVY